MARVKYGYAESSDLAATYGDGHMLSVVDENNELENGMIVKLGRAIDRENNTISTAADADPIVLILDVILPYDESTTEAGFECYYNFAKGKCVRAYTIIPNDKWSVIDYMVTTLAGEGKPAVVGNYVVHDGNRKYKEVSAEDEDFDMSKYGFVAEIAEITYRGGMTLYLLNVLKNERTVS